MPDNVESIQLTASCVVGLAGSVEQSFPPDEVVMDAVRVGKGVHIANTAPLNQTRSE